MFAAVGRWTINLATEIIEGKVSVVGWGREREREIGGGTVARKTRIESAAINHLAWMPNYEFDLPADNLVLRTFMI